MIDFSRPYTGANECDRCPSQGRFRTATRRMYGPDGEPLGYMCRECADVWNGCIHKAIEMAAAELAEAK